ncbi:indoleamine 2,3-dioxygenase 2-like isoform X2 [Pleurodeles waltl]|uniref:indoleamine 2,3-dioxygenase 2-like isoform X2 n=1 Tax=Pleurodeles waltl TaxID=8319 RepID=UPI003709C547
MEIQTFDSKNLLPFNLSRFHISEDYGFIVENPLTELPSYYAPWMEAATNLTYLIENHQLRSKIDQVLPGNLAIPYWEVSHILGLPPILVHADFALVNWKKRNPDGTLEIENLDPIISFPGGESLRGFILVTILVEKEATPGIKGIVQAVNAILETNDESLIEALQQITRSLEKMKEVFKKMHDYVDPAIFYTVIRIFLSGWRDNLAMPDGLTYEGVSEEPMAYSGGSAAQSTTLHAFDEFLGVQHSQESAAFLHRMRDYMPPSHKAFLEAIRLAPPLQQHVTSSGNKKLCIAYNSCVEALVELRNYHIAVVSKYVSIAGVNARAKKAKSMNDGKSLPTPPSSLEAKGTGGTGIMCFLKSVRDTTKKVVFNS